MTIQQDTKPELLDPDRAPQSDVEREEVEVTSIAAEAERELVRIVEQYNPDDTHDQVVKWVADWIRCRVPALGGVTPLSLMGTREGVEVVRNLLHAACEGSYM